MNSDVNFNEVNEAEIMSHSDLLCLFLFLLVIYWCICGISPYMFFFY